LAVLGGKLPPSRTQGHRSSFGEVVVRTAVGLVARQNGPVARSSRNSAASLRLSSVLLLAVALVGPLAGQIREGFRGSAWKFPEYYELPLIGRSQTNRLKGMILGEHGQHLSNRVFRVTHMHLEHYELDGRTNLLARAPECLFDMETRVAWSTGRLEIVGMGGAMHVEGNAGFQARMTNSVLLISNRVRTVIRQDLVKSSKP
jgi:hypothetical protein